MKPLNSAQRKAREKEIGEKIARDSAWLNPSPNGIRLELNVPSKDASEMSSQELDAAWRSSAFRKARDPKPDPEIVAVIGDDGVERRVRIVPT